MIHDGSLGLKIKCKVKTRDFDERKKLKAKLSDGDDVITLCSQMAPTDKNASLWVGGWVGIMTMMVHIKQSPMFPLRCNNIGQKKTTISPLSFLFNLSALNSSFSSSTLSRPNPSSPRSR